MNRGPFFGRRLRGVPDALPTGLSRRPGAGAVRTGSLIGPGWIQGRRPRKAPKGLDPGFDFFSAVSNNSQHVASRAEIGATRRRECSETWAPAGRRGLSIFGPHFRRKPPLKRAIGAPANGAPENPEIRISGSRQDVIGGGLLASGGAFSDVSDACFRGGFRRKRGPEIDRPRRPAGARI